MAGSDETSLPAFASRYLSAPIPKKLCVRRQLRRRQAPDAASRQLLAPDAAEPTRPARRHPRRFPAEGMPARVAQQVVRGMRQLDSTPRCATALGHRRPRHTAAR